MSKKVKTKTVKSGQTVSLHYVGKLDDGTEFDSSRSRESTISVEVGSGNLITGFDEALEGMKVGEIKNVQLTPDKAYGTIDEEAFRTVPNSSFPPDFDLKEGAMVQGEGPTGKPLIATINSVDEGSVVLNFNHPLAGKILNFEIEVVSIDKK
jgi:peptidylprolyl isomerase